MKVEDGNLDLGEGSIEGKLLLTLLKWRVEERSLIERNQWKIPGLFFLRFRSWGEEGVGKNGNQIGRE